MAACSGCSKVVHSAVSNVHHRPEADILGDFDPIDRDLQREDNRSSILTLVPMHLGEAQITYSFDVLGGEAHIGTITARGKELTVLMRGQRAFYRLSDIESVTLMELDAVNLARPAAGLLIGGFLAGPLAAVGAASIAKVARECRFMIDLSNGRRFLCKGANKDYEAFEAHRRAVAQAIPDMRKIEAIIAKPIPAVPAAKSRSTQDVKATAITMAVPAVKPIKMLLVPTKTDT